MSKASPASSASDGSGKGVEQSTEHFVRGFNHCRTGLRKQKGLAQIEQRIGQILIGRIRDLLRVLIQLLIAGGDRGLSGTEGTRQAHGGRKTADGAHRRYVGSPRQSFRRSRFDRIRG